MRKIVVDDNIIMKSKISTAGSKMLHNFAPPYCAAVIDRLIKAGYADIKQAKPNEFGVSLTEAFGCVDSVAAGEADVGLGIDINGSIRKEASKNSICFIKPTYGTVSRYGIVSVAPSMEQVGVACNNFTDGFEALSIIAGHDERDGTLAPTVEYNFTAHEKDLAGMKIAVPSGCEEKLKDVLLKLKGLGASVKAIEFNELESVPCVSYIILAAEAGNSISRFDGIKFGYRTQDYLNLDDIYVKSRTESFSFETKLLTLMSILVLSKENFEGYYKRALWLRRIIKTVMDDVFKEYDAVVTPAEHSDAGEPFEKFCGSYKNLKYLALPNLTGCPAIALPGGVQFIARTFDENTLFRIGNCLNEKEAAR